jgi:quercetin dioxygenase-like cupin family protein
VKRICMSVGLLLVAASLPAANGDDPAKPMVVTPVLSTSVTSSGQPIALPTKDVTVAVSTYGIAKGATLPEHEHPYPRYGYVLAGEIRITNIETGKNETYKTGDFIIEAIGRWHRAVNVGDGPVELLVIDRVEGAGSNVIIRR